MGLIINCDKILNHTRFRLQSNNAPSQAPVYKLVTTSDINSGKLLKKRVELQGTITRCYVVKSLKDLKLLNFTDSSGNFFNYSSTGFNCGSQLNSK